MTLGDIQDAISEWKSNTPWWKRIVSPGRWFNPFGMPKSMVSLYELQQQLVQERKGRNYLLSDDERETIRLIIESRHRRGSASARSLSSNSSLIFKGLQEKLEKNPARDPASASSQLHNEAPHVRQQSSMPDVEVQRNRQQAPQQNGKQQQLQNELRSLQQKFSALAQKIPVDLVLKDDSLRFVFPHHLAENKRSALNNLLMNKYRFETQGGVNREAQAFIAIRGRVNYSFPQSSSDILQDYQTVLAATPADPLRIQPRHAQPSHRPQSSAVVHITPAMQQAQWLQSKFQCLQSPNIQLSIQPDPEHLRFTVTGTSASAMRTFLFVVLNRVYGFDNIAVGQNRYEQRIIEISGRGNQRFQNSSPEQIRQQIRSLLTVISSQQPQPSSSASSSSHQVEQPGPEVWNKVTQKIKDHWHELSLEMRAYISTCVATDLEQFYANIQNTAVLGDGMCPIGQTRAIQIPVHLPARDKKANMQQVYELEYVLGLPIHQGRQRRDPMDQENRFTLKELNPAVNHFQHLQQCAQVAAQPDTARSSPTYQ